MIQNAQLRELVRGDFNSAKNLNYLKVQGNEIRVLDDHLFQGAEKNLQNLEMISNQIEDHSRALLNL